MFHDVAIDRQHAILHGIGAWHQDREADRQLLGIIWTNLDIPAIHLLAARVPHGERAEVGFKPFVEPELHPGGHAGQHRPVDGYRFDQTGMGPDPHGESQHQPQETDPERSYKHRHPFHRVCGASRRGLGLHRWPPPRSAMRDTPKPTTIPPTSAPSTRAMILISTASGGSAASTSTRSITVGGAQLLASPPTGRT